MNPIAIDTSDTELAEAIEPYQQIPWGGIKLLSKILIGATTSALAATALISEPFLIAIVGITVFSVYAVCLLRSETVAWWQRNAKGYSLLIEEEVAGICRYSVIESHLSFVSRVVILRTEQQPVFSIALGGWTNRHRIHVRDATGFQWSIITFNLEKVSIRLHDGKSNILWFRFGKALLAVRRWETKDCDTFQDLPFPDKLSLTTFALNDERPTLYC